MTFDDAAYIVLGIEPEGPGWEQQQECEARRFAEEEERLRELIASIDACRRAVEEAMDELKRFEAVYGPKVSRSARRFQGGNGHELHL